MDVTAKMNIVALASPLLAARGPITVYSELREVVGVLLASILPWEKFTRPSLKSCPNLASADIAPLELSPEADQILDSVDTFKRVKGGVDEKVEVSHLLDLEGVQQPQMGTGVVRGGDDMHLEYTRGLTLRLIRS